MFSAHPVDWHRKPRAAISLSVNRGVYALFLRNGSEMPGIERPDADLLYIGMANSKKGFLGRCHFKARTANHSPRKSLAVVLMDRLALVPVLVPKPNSPDTWSLDPISDARLTEWMHANLELALEVCEDPVAREKELIGQYAPPLNLEKCEQGAQHKIISAGRSRVMTDLKR